MGTKANPGSFDCYNNAADDEPMFVLFARDEQAPQRVRDWAFHRLSLVRSGLKPLEDLDKVTEALKCADDMVAWRNAKPAVAIPAGQYFGPGWRPHYKPVATGQAGSNSSKNTVAVSMKTPLEIAKDNE